MTKIKLLQVNSQPDNQTEQESDVSSSDSELNCSDVAANSDHEQMGEQNDKSGVTGSKKPDDMMAQKMFKY